MHLLVLGGSHVEAEFRQKFGPNHQYTFLTAHFLEADAADEELDTDPYEQHLAALEEGLANADAIFIYQLDGFWNFERGDYVVFYEGSTRALNAAVHDHTPVLFGFCGLPTLLNRPLLEVSLNDPADATKLAEVCAALGTDYRVVEDRVGLVTPRVVCMIINEACYTLQEGTASIRDIDLAMKLGTNYPKGPFEWANAIGVERVYETLQALWEDTRDERYKVCPLLKRMALRGEAFAL